MSWAEWSSWWHLQPRCDDRQLRRDSDEFVGIQLVVRLSVAWGSAMGKCLGWSGCVAVVVATIALGTVLEFTWLGDSYTNAKHPQSVQTVRIQYHLTHLRISALYGGHISILGLSSNFSVRRMHQTFQPLRQQHSCIERPLGLQGIGTLRCTAVYSFLCPCGNAQSHLLCRGSFVDSHSADATQPREYNTTQCAAL